MSLRVLTAREGAQNPCATLEPFRLDQATAQRGGRLLILASEIVFAERPPDMLEGFERLALGVQSLALNAGEASRSPNRLDPVRRIAVRKLTTGPRRGE
jgi:hypothetical protein